MVTKEQVVKILQTIKDPEVDLDIWTMGLIYNLTVKKDAVEILLTYTTPFCPWGPQINEEITEALQNLGIKKVKIKVTFDPPYKMPEELRAMLGV